VGEEVVVTVRARVRVAESEGADGDRGELDPALRLVGLGPQAKKRSASAPVPAWASFATRLAKIDSW